MSWASGLQYRGRSNQDLTPDDKCPSVSTVSPSLSSTCFCLRVSQVLLLETVPVSLPHTHCQHT